MTSNQVGCLSLSESGLEAFPWRKGAPVRTTDPGSEPSRLHEAG